MSFKSHHVHKYSACTIAFNPTSYCRLDLLKIKSGTDLETGKKSYQVQVYMHFGSFYLTSFSLYPYINSCSTSSAS